MEEDLWLGYQKPNSHWDDGSPFSWTKWIDGEPNRDSERCIGLSLSTKWFDLPCEDSNHVYRGLCQGSGNV